MALLEKPDCSHISPTGLWTAHNRQNLGIPYADRMAEFVDTAAAAAQFNTSREAEIMTTAYLEGRYWTIDRLMRESGIRQVIVLAAGLQTYCMDWTSDPLMVCVETDLPDVITLKKDLSEEIVGMRPNLLHAALDATDRQELAEQVERYIDLKRETLVISEGLLPYLDDEEQSLVTGKIARFLWESGGLWVTTDLIKRPTESTGAIKDLRQKVAQETRRTLNTFASQEEVDALLASHGLAGERHPLNWPADGPRTAEKFGITAEEAKARTERFDAFSIRLAG